MPFLPSTSTSDLAREHPSTSQQRPANDPDHPRQSPDNMTPAPTLLEFPREIRQRIWHHLFTGSCIRTDVNADTGRRHALSTSYLPWQITATCVQTRRETLPLLVACIELHYTGTFETEALAQDVPDTYRRYIGAITYTRGSGNAGWWLLQSAEMAYHQLFPGVRRLHIDSRLLKCQVTVANEGDARKTLLAQAPACGPLVHLVMENSRHPFAEVISTLRSKRPASLTPLQVTFQASAIMQLDWKYLQEIYPQLRLRKYREKEAGAVEFVRLPPGRPSHSFHVR